MTDWSWALYVGAGLGILLIGVGIFIVCLRLAAVLTRSLKTLDVVDEQLGNLSTPVAETLSHVGGIADTADQTVAKLSGIVGSLEGVAGSVGKTATLAQEAITPSLVNIGSTLTGVTAGLKRLTRGKNSRSDGVPPAAAASSEEPA